jgi:hypothetical protein
MIDDRTPYEIAMKMEGETLNSWRNTKRVLKIQDPTDFTTCPKCQTVVLGKSPERCEVCMTEAEDRDRAARVEQKKETGPGSLLKKARGQEEESLREQKARWWDK